MRTLLNRTLVIVAIATSTGAAAAVIATPAVAVAATSTNLYADVSASGELASGSHVTSSAEIATGRYEVTFDRDVSACAYVATTANHYERALMAFTAGGHASANGVYVETRRQPGGLASAPFDLVVDCGSVTTPYAVVGYRDNLVRASTGVTLDPLGDGRFDVTFPINVRGCAAVATVGDPGAARVQHVNSVYTGEAADSHTIYLETKNLEGGLESRVPFHLAVLCPGTADVHTATVRPHGVLHRGSGDVQSYSGSTGDYVLVTGSSIAACATVATRGSTGTAVPFAPATVETVPGPASNTVGIELRGLLFFGGDPIASAFHAAVVC